MGTWSVVISALCTLDSHCHANSTRSQIAQNLKILVFFIPYYQNTAVSTRQHEPTAATAFGETPNQTLLVVDWKL